MRNSFLIFLVYFAFAQVVFTQSIEEDFSKQGDWNELKLELTTSKDIIDKLGKPNSDKKKYLSRFVQKDWSKINSNNKVRILKYKKLENYKSVEFYLLDDKLIALDIKLKQNKLQGLFNNKSNLLKANKVLEVFERNFLMVQSIPKGAKIADYEGQKETTIPKVYPQRYSMLGISSKSIMLLDIAQLSWKSGLKELLNKPTIEQFPGYVQKIQVVSRK